MLKAPLLNDPCIYMVLFEKVHTECPVCAFSEAEAGASTSSPSTQVHQPVPPTSNKSKKRSRTSAKEQLPKDKPCIEGPPKQTRNVDPQPASTKPALPTLSIAHAAELVGSPPPGPQEPQHDGFNWWVHWADMLGTLRKEGSLEVAHQVAYALLGVDPGATTPAAIRTLYLRVSLKVHPDKVKHANANQRFECLVRAYETLKEGGLAD